jgi:four helix bundle protein
MLIFKFKGMNRYYDELSERFIGFSVNILKLEKVLCKTYSGRHIFGQLFRASTSAGANYEEARAGESKADFVHKMQIVLKELRESGFWIKLIIASELNSSLKDDLILLQKEVAELSMITAKSILTAKSNMSKR